MFAARKNRSVWSAWLLFLLLLWSMAAGAVSRDEHAVALVIGNNAYKNAPLRSPINDARAMSERLRGLGFDVIERTNLKTREIAPTLREFRSRLKPGSVALIFYAGHGLQIKGVNYLPTVDADIESEDDVALQSIDLNRMLDGLGESKTRLNLVFLDACRNNPFTRSFRSSASGLAKVDAPSGTLISFATRPGSTAYDGDGTHGLYTEHLLRHMNMVDVPVELMLKRVVSGVKKDSRGQQEPWMEGSIEGDFSFVGNPAATTGKKMAEPVKPAAPDNFAVELAFWESIRGSKNPREYQAYLKKYPDGQFAELASEHANSSRTLEVLNRPPPDSKVVTLRASPCAELSSEACQQKSTEAMLEAGRLFRAKNFGRALTHFETAIAAQPTADAYYFAAICHQKMQEEVAAIERLRDGIAAFPSEPALHRAHGMLYFQRGEARLAHEQIVEVLRLSPNDRQAAFILDRLDNSIEAKQTEVYP